MDETTSNGSLKQLYERNEMTTTIHNVSVKLAQDSIWNCPLTATDDICIQWIEDSGSHVTCAYTVNGVEAAEDSWTIYTDSGFEAAVSKLVGRSVKFTEQGMQADGFASME